MTNNVASCFTTVQFNSILHSKNVTRSRLYFSSSLQLTVLLIFKASGNVGNAYLHEELLTVPKLCKKFY